MIYWEGCTLTHTDLDISMNVRMINIQILLRLGESGETENCITDGGVVSLTSCLLLLSLPVCREIFQQCCWNYNIKVPQLRTSCFRHKQVQQTKLFFVFHEKKLKSMFKMYAFPARG